MPWLLVKFQTLCSLFQVIEVPEVRDEGNPFADEDARGRVENLLTAFRSHMEINSDPPKKLTRSKYVSNMRRFLKDEAKKNPSFGTLPIFLKWTDLVTVFQFCHQSNPAFLEFSQFPVAKA